MNRTIAISVASTTDAVYDYTPITSGDSDAYLLSVTFTDLTSISGTCNLHFVLGDGTTADRDDSDGVTITDNIVTYTLPTVLYSQTGLVCYVQFMNSNIYTPLKITFGAIRILPGGTEVSTTETYPQWAADAISDEEDRVAAELLRVSAEEDRVTAEANRAVWEEFDPLDVYAVGNKVYYLGSSYIMHTVSGVAGTLPTDTDYWAIIAQKGDAVEMTIGTVTTLAPGESATVSNSGTSTDAVLDIGIPAGYDGSAVPIDDASTAADRVLSAQYVKEQLSAVDAQLAETEQRIDNIITTPVPTGEVIAQEITDARQGELSVGANFTKIKQRLDQIVTINLLKYNIPLDGVTDARPAINAAIAEADSAGGAKIVAPYCNNGYSISGQVTLNYNTELDLQGSVLKPIGAFNVSGSALCRMMYSGNVIKNVIFNISTAQYGIEFGNTSFKNIEMNCQSLAGYNNLIKVESENIKSYLNRSLTLESISKGSVPQKTVKKLEFNYTVGGNSYTSRKRLRPFPSRCLITMIKVTDINGSPDFSFEIEAPATNYIYNRTRASSNISENMVLDYFNTSLDDLFLFGIYNFKATETTFKIEIYYTNERSSLADKVWEFVSASDFIRPHYDSIAPNTAFSATTVKQMEYRFKDNVNTTHKIGVTPVRKPDANYQYPQLLLPTPALTQDHSSYSEIKFYFDYPASRAVLEKPKKLIVKFHQVPKEITTRLIVGWYSQNPDRSGVPAYLKSIPIVEKDIIIPVTATYDNPYQIEILLDPKGCQAGSAIEGPQSFNFLHFVLWQKDGTYTPFLFGEEYIFNAYIER